MEKIIEFDKSLFSFLYQLGSEPFDDFWLIITKQIYWTPLFIGVFYLLQKKIGWKNLGIIVLFLAILLICTDQTTNIFKNGFQRLRPCNNPEFQDFLREVIVRKSFSFFSGHASNSMASTMFVVLILRKYYNYTFSLFLFPLIFAYSRIYLGLHYPLDIISGYVFGAINGLFFYKLYAFFAKKYNLKTTKPY